MIVEEHLVVDARLTTVLTRIMNALELGDIDASLTADVAQTHERLIRAGIAGVTKSVRLKTLPPRVIDDAVVVGIRWDSVGASGELFPSLDANLELRHDGEDRTLLGLTGSYRPPFGRLGATLDRLLLHQVAEATIRNFLGQLAQIAVESEPTTDLEPDVSSQGPEMPAPETSPVETAARSGVKA